LRAPVSAACFGQAMTRRRAAASIGAGFGLVLLAACGSGKPWHALDVSGSSPPLALTMTRASDGREVTAADYRRQVVMLYFGYTFCPDICPTTLANVAAILDQLGHRAKHVRVLFVTVDPDRDTAPVLTAYVKNFAPQIDGLRGTPDQLAALARRYRIAYSVTPESGDHPYEVTHSSAIYVFDASGAARLLISSLGTAEPDIRGPVADLKRLVAETAPQGLFDRLRRWFSRVASVAGGTAHREARRDRAAIREA
jgi:protein SCO1